MHTQVSFQCLKQSIDLQEQDLYLKLYEQTLAVLPVDRQQSERGIQGNQTLNIQHSSEQSKTGIVGRSIQGNQTSRNCYWKKTYLASKGKVCADISPWITMRWERKLQQDSNRCISHICHSKYYYRKNIIPNINHLIRASPTASLK